MGHQGTSIGFIGGTSKCRSKRGGQAEKLTWKQLREFIETADIHEDDEIDYIDICWASAEQLKLEKDDDFGWRLSQES